MMKNDMTKSFIFICMCGK